MASSRVSFPPSSAISSIYGLLSSFPVACFTLALLTDVAFWGTSNLMWQNFSAWLLFAGLVFGAFAILARTVDVLAHPEMRGHGAFWPHAAIGLIVLALSLVNSLVHAGDGWTAVVPNGLILSAATVVLMLVVAWLGRSMHDYRETGASDHV